MSAMATDPPSVRPPSARTTLTAIATAPFTRRARAELSYLVVAAPIAIAVPVGAVAFLVVLGFLAPGPAKPENVSFAGLAAGALVLFVLATRLARRLGSLQRRLAARLLGERVAEPPPGRGRPGRGLLGRLDPRLRDGAGWRAVAYLLLRVPVALLGLYAVEYWVTGLANLSYPFWWGLFRNLPPDAHLSPVPFLTPLRTSPFHITTYPGTLLAFAAGVASLLVAPVTDGEALLTAVAEHGPDVAVVDIRMPPTHTDEGLRAAIDIRRDHPETAVLVFSQYIEPRYAARLLEGGAAKMGYLLKDRVADVAEFTEALTRVAEGGTALDPEVVGQLLRAGRPGLDTLTLREREVLALMAEGRSNAGIAAGLTISTGSVEKHVAGIFAKLDLPPSQGDNRRVLAVLQYLRS